ncbi:MULTISPECIES: ATP-binding protein [Halomonadaceae]|jgi:two-component system sensor histidine kinase RegB|uniref:histidine kinase n=1 Tax=Vreelandella janggokensis TaxID=370767 RepID=A0ABT4IS98_9GAMM|nr:MULTISPECIES: ATP-binding protein [Halomonas]MCW4148019.1 ATP-binding protein [Halomonas sp. 18H]MCZ0926534.1 ATP-binding protein [Halomonas janggokensis]MCZ0929072.1 ATP-binding protein [Halomonas janggokensis]MDR5885498.1 ATP-binding protein [Halomonas janggokensis]QPL47934.1 HAMP domain-containing histidine kinase [Halomonas sp. A40-4]
MPTELPLPLSTPNRNLVRLTIVRGITWTGFLIAIIVGVKFLSFELPVPEVVSVVLAMGLLNIATWWRLGRPRAVRHLEYLLHLLADIVGLTLLFYFSGGSTNPFITYYLVPITIAAATLPWRHAWIIAGCAMAAYSFLMIDYHPIPQLGHINSGSPLSLHVLGMWVNFGMSAGLVTFFIYKMAHALRRRDQALSRTREAALRNEQVLAVATQAAGTAHELGTPLSTMAVLLKDMQEEAKDHPERQEDIELLRQQVDICKSRLQHLVNQADRRRMAEPEVLDAETWLGGVVQRWLVLRPDVSHQLDIASRRGRPWLAVDATLDQALTNLLNNAADANPEDIAIGLDWHSDRVVIDIRDHGPGVAMSIADQLGDTFISTKSKGMGIGLFLTHATINRFGGGVSLYNHPEGGTLTEVTLPRADAD